MGKIKSKWIEDAAVTNDKLNADVAGTGISGGAGSALALDINGLTLESARDLADALAVYDDSASAIRKMALSSIFASRAATLYVSATGGNDSNDGLSPERPKATLQAAVTAAPAYSLIWLSPEQHTITASINFVTAGLTIMGMGPGQADTANPGGSPMATIYLDAGAASQPTLAAYGALGGRCTFANLKFHLEWDGAAGNTAAVVKATTAGAQINIKDCFVYFEATGSTTGGTAICVWANGGNVDIQDSVAEVGGSGLTSLDLFRGVLIDAASEVRARNLTMLGATAPFIVDHASAEAWIRDCDFYTLYVNTADEVHLDGANRITSVTDVVGGKITYGAQGLYLPRSAELWVSKDGSDDNPGTSPELPKLTIQAAIDALGDNNTLIRVGPGFFAEPLTVGDYSVTIHGAERNYGLQVGPRTTINPTLSSTGAAISRTGSAAQVILRDVEIAPQWTGATGTCHGIDATSGGGWMLNSVFFRPTVNGAGASTTLRAMELGSSGYLAAHYVWWTIYDYTPDITTGEKTQLRINTTSVVDIWDSFFDDSSNGLGNVDVVNASATVNLKGVQVAGTLDVVSGATVNVDSGSFFNEVDGDLTNRIYLNRLISTATFEEEYDNGNLGATPTIDWNNGQKQVGTVSANITSITMTAPPGPGHFQFKFVQNGTGGYTVPASVWASNTRTPGGAAPVISTPANSISLLSVYYDGTNYFLAWHPDQAWAEP